MSVGQEHINITVSHYQGAGNAARNPRDELDIFFWWMLPDGKLSGHRAPQLEIGAWSLTLS